MVDFTFVTDCNLDIDDGERYEGVVGLLWSASYVLQSHEKLGGRGGRLLLVLALFYKILGSNLPTILAIRES